MGKNWTSGALSEKNLTRDLSCRYRSSLCPSFSLSPSLYIYMFDKMTAKLRATLRISEILMAKSQNL